MYGLCPTNLKIVTVQLERGQEDNLEDDPGPVTEAVGLRKSQRTRRPTWKLRALNDDTQEECA